MPSRPPKFRPEAWLASLALIAICVISLCNVIVRYTTDASFAFTEEFSVFLLVLLTFAGAAVAARSNQHIRIELQLRLARRGTQELHGGVRQDEGGLAPMGEVETLLPTDRFQEGVMLAAHFVAAARPEQRIGQDEPCLGRSFRPIHERTDDRANAGGFRRFQHQRRNHLSDIIALALAEGVEDRLPVREVLVERANTDAGTVSNVICGQVCEAIGFQKLKRSFQYSLHRRLCSRLPWFSSCLFSHLCVPICLTMRIS